MNLTAQTQDLLKQAEAMLAKATFTQATGLVQFNLEAPAKKLYPVITPLRNSTPRVTTVGGTQANWKAITAININNLSMGVSEGNRGGEIAVQTNNYSASFAGLGLESSYTFESEYAAEGFDDIRARNSESLLRSVMIGEEAVILGGLATYALGTPAAPVAALGGTAQAPGTLADATAYKLWVVGLSYEGYQRASVAGGCPGQITRNNADGSQDQFGGGNSAVSAASNAVTTAVGANNLTVKGTVTAMRGAVAYAWYIGTAAGTAKLAAITTTNTVTIAALPAGTQLASDLAIAADYSQNDLVVDGFLSIAFKAGSNAYIKSLDGATLTSSGAGTVSEIDAALKDRWDNYRLSPTVMYVNSQEILNITNKVVANGGAPLVRFNFDAAKPMQEQISLAAGTVVGWYLNKFTMAGGQLIPIKLHPNVPAGTIVMLTETLPYPLTNVTNVFQWKLRRDYYQIEWPIVSRKRGFGVYFDGVLQHYFPPSIMVISNIANG